MPNLQIRRGAIEEYPPGSALSEQSILVGVRLREDSVDVEADGMLLAGGMHYKRQRVILPIGIGHL